MRREAQNLLLLMLGGALLKPALTGTDLHYVRAGFRPWLLAAGAVVVVLAGIAIHRDLREPPEPNGTSGSWRSWLLLLPVLAVFAVGPSPLGADAVSRGPGADAISRGPGADTVPRGPGATTDRGIASGSIEPHRGVTRLTMTDFVSLARSGHLAAEDRKIRLRGFVMHGTDGEAQLARFRIDCCAADAVAVRVDLVGSPAKRADALPDDTWIEVSGVLRSDTADDRIPGMDVTAVRLIPEPERPYES